MNEFHLVMVLGLVSGSKPHYFRDYSIVMILFAIVATALAEHGAVSEYEMDDNTKPKRKP